jgi:hypothetical protein
MGEAEVTIHQNPSLEILKADRRIGLDLNSPVKCLAPPLHIALFREAVYPI